jgi:hypothetical protein
MRDIAYQQATSLDVLEPSHISAIRDWLVEAAKQGRLRREEKVIKAYLLRLDQAEHLLNIVRFLKVIPYLSLVLGIAVTSLVYVRFLGDYSQPFLAFVSFSLVLPFLVRIFVWKPFRNRLTAISFLLASVAILSLLFQLDLNSVGNYLFIYGASFGYFYAFVWQFYAYGLAEEGVFAKPHQWPIALMAPLVLIPIGLARKDVSSTVAWLRKSLGDIVRQIHSEHGLIRMAGSLLFLIAFSGALGWLLFSPRVPVVIQVAIVFVPVVIVVLMLFFGSFLPAIRAYIRARRHLRETSAKSTEIIMDEYLQALRDYLSEEFYVRYTRLIRERRLLGNSPENLRLLIRLTSRLQHDLLVKQENGNLEHDSATVTIKDDPFLLWYRSFLIRRKQLLHHPLRLIPPARAQEPYGISFLGWEMLDELNLLLEQIKQQAKHPSQY